MQTLKTLWKRVPHFYFLLLLGLTFGVSLTEGIGIFMLVPLLGLFTGDEPSSSLYTLVTKPLIDLGLINSNYADNLVIWLVIFNLLILFRVILQYSRDTLSMRLQNNVVDSLRKECFQALMQAEWRWLSEKRKSDHLSLLLTDVSRVGTGLFYGISLIASITTILALLGASFLLSWYLTLLAILFGAILFWGLTGLRRKSRELGENLSAANRELQNKAQEAFHGIRVAKILGSESIYSLLFNKTVNNLQYQREAFALENNKARALTQLAASITLCIFLYYGLTLGTIATAELIILVLIFSRLVPLLISSQQQIQHCLHAWPALNCAFQLLDECKVNAEPISTETTFVWSVKKSVEIDQVTVRYQGRKNPAINNLTFSLPANTTTALIGASGSGKSTLADVIMGILLPDAGSIRIDGETLNQGNRLRWRRSIAYVPQEVFLFNDTIFNNLLLASPNAGEIDCINALKMASADFVLALPDGLNTVIGDGGIILSGGEKQRIALARALICYPSLLILDESTSSLDSENESRINEAIRAMHGKVTTLIVGHRVSVTEHADYVIRLGNGNSLESV
jgi:ATP-binding cassette subfamily C protein